MSHATILVVEDSYSCREAAAEIIRHMGYRVVCAETCRQAMRILEDCDPVLLILDVALPDGSGLEFLHHVRDSLHKDLPVILFTGSGDVRAMVCGLGVCSCLIKSQVATSHIRAAVDGALHRPRTANPYLLAS